MKRRNWQISERNSGKDTYITIKATTERVGTEMNPRIVCKGFWSTTNIDSTTMLEKLHRKAHNGISLQYTDLISNSKKVMKR